MSNNINISDSNQDQTNELVQNDNIKKFLTFISDKLTFGIDASYVTEIIIKHNITFLPIVPYYIKGIINLRGQIIPIIDIRLKMGKEEYIREDGSNCIIVLNIDSTMLGIMVDTVNQVLDVDTKKISPPTVNNCVELVNGMITINDNSTVLILDCNAIKKI